MNFSKLSGWMRLGIVVSVVWVVFVYATSNLEDFVLAGILPLIVIWGMCWIIKGFKNIKRKSEGAELIPKEQKDLNNELANEGKKELSAKRGVKVSPKVKTLFLISLVLSILMIGICALHIGALRQQTYAYAVGATVTLLIYWIFYWLLGVAFWSMIVAFLARWGKMNYKNAFWISFSILMVIATWVFAAVNWQGESIKF